MAPSSGNIFDTMPPLLHGLKLFFFNGVFLVAIVC